MINKNQKKTLNEKLFELNPHFSEKSCKESLEEVLIAWDVPLKQRTDIIDEFIIHLNLKRTYEIK